MSSDCLVTISVFDFSISVGCLPAVLSRSRSLTLLFQWGVFRLSCYGVSLRLFYFSGMSSDCLVTISVFDFSISVGCLPAVLSRSRSLTLLFQWGVFRLSCYGVSLRLFYFSGMSSDCLVTISVFDFSISVGCLPAVLSRSRSLTLLFQWGVFRLSCYGVSLRLFYFSRLSSGCLVFDSFILVRFIPAALLHFIRVFVYSVSVFILFCKCV